MRFASIQADKAEYRSRFSSPCIPVGAIAGGSIDRLSPTVRNTRRAMTVSVFVQHRAAASSSNAWHAGDVIRALGGRGKERDGLSHRVQRRDLRPRGGRVGNR